MTKNEAIEIRAKISIRELAKSVNEEGDVGQAALINELGHSMKISCTSAKLETQISYMADLLNDDGKHLIKELNEFLEIKKSW